MVAIDYLTEEYAKLLLRFYGAYRVYDAVVILEDEQATGLRLAETLLRLGPAYTTDLLLLVHGHEGKLVGYCGQELIGSKPSRTCSKPIGTTPMRLTCAWYSG